MLKNVPLSRTALIAIVAAVSLALAPVALASRSGRGGSAGGTTSSYAVTISPTGPYYFGEAISITTNAPLYPGNLGPWIELDCYQNGTLVLAAGHAGFSSGWYYEQPFHLGPTAKWTSGPGSCTVTVFHESGHKTITDATTSFSVSG
jgi:hypothetical protein